MQLVGIAQKGYVHVPGSIHFEVGIDAIGRRDADLCDGVPIRIQFPDFMGKVPVSEIPVFHQQVEVTGSVGLHALGKVLVKNAAGLPGFDIEDKPLRAGFYQRKPLQIGDRTGAFPVGVGEAGNPVPPVDEAEDVAIGVNGGFSPAVFEAAEEVAPLPLLAVGEKGQECKQERQSGFHERDLDGLK